MSGVDGHGEWMKQVALWLKGLGRRLQHALIRESVYGDTVVCLLPVGRASIQLMLWQIDAGSWLVKQSVQEPITPRIGNELVREEDFPAQFADAAGLRLAQLGWNGWPRLLILPEEVVLGYVLRLPPDMSAEERTEAAYWELEAKAAEQGWDVEQCQTVQAELNEGDFWMAAVERSDLQLWQQSFTTAELPLAELIIMAPAETNSFSVGDQVPKERVCGLLQASRSRGGICWDYRRLALVWLASVLFFLSGWTGWDCWQLYAARQEAAQAQQDLAQLGPDQQRMERLESVRQEIDVKNQQLQALSAKNFPWYSVLVHFGSMTTEGAWLDGLQLEDGDVLQIKGQAVSFEALADYIKAFEQDRDFFPQGPVLKSSSVDKDIVSFQLSLHL
ncbi:MAG: PilN domain-containing protein [Selenomonas sp.]|nr:PilN domain-containing protein [Selenomonas sp.]